ncbi:hypothetical protein HKCCE4037_12360 [Rhodobacterales bacterium HKCCE4037]|nr:hypothetical protein [Rhodobacterales bacterium HKCCE4037]
MTIFPPTDVADRIGLVSGGIMVLQSNILWARRDRFAYCVEALIDIEIAYRTEEGYVILRRNTLVNTPINRTGGRRARLTRTAALLTAVISAPPRTPKPQNSDPRPALPLAA